MRGPAGSPSMFQCRVADFAFFLSIAFKFCGSGGWPAAGTNRMEIVCKQPPIFSRRVFMGKDEKVYLSVGTIFRNRWSNTWNPYHSLSLYHTKRRKTRRGKGEVPVAGKYWEWLPSPPFPARKRKSHDNRCLRLGNMRGMPHSYWEGKNQYFGWRIFGFIFYSFYRLSVPPNSQKEVAVCSPCLGCPWKLVVDFIATHLVFISSLLFSTSHWV